MQIKKFLCLILVMVSITSYVYAMNESSLIAEKTVCKIRDFFLSERANIKPNADWATFKYYTEHDHIIKGLIFEHYQDIGALINSKDAYAEFISTFDMSIDIDTIHTNMIKTVFYVCLHVSENDQDNKILNHDTIFTSLVTYLNKKYKEILRDLYDVNSALNEEYMGKIDAINKYNDYKAFQQKKDIIFLLVGGLLIGYILKLEFF